MAEREFLILRKFVCAGRWNALFLRLVHVLFRKKGAFTRPENAFLDMALLVAIAKLFAPVRVRRVSRRRQLYLLRFYYRVQEAGLLGLVFPHDNALPELGPRWEIVQLTLIGLVFIEALPDIILHREEAIILIAHLSDIQCRLCTFSLRGVVAGGVSIAIADHF